MAEQKAKKSRSIKRSFISDSGETSPRATNDTKTVVLTYENEQSHSLDLAQVFGGSLPGPCVGRAAAAFGLSTSLGNAGNTAAYAKAKETGEEADPDTIWEAVNDRLENILRGEWAEEREGAGPPTTLLIETFKVFRQQVVGKPVVDAQGNVTDQARIDDFKKAIADKATRDGYLKDPEFGSLYEKLKYERAVERRKSQAAQASGLRD